MAEASRRASTNSSQTHLMSSMSRNSPSGSSQNMRVSVWWCTRTSSILSTCARRRSPPCTLPCGFTRVRGRWNGFGQRERRRRSVVGVVCTNRVASETARRGSGDDTRCAWPSRRIRDESSFAHAAQRETAGDAPQLRQLPPRRRPPVHVQHEVDDRDAATHIYSHRCRVLRDSSD